MLTLNYSGSVRVRGHGGQPDGSDGAFIRLKPSESEKVDILHRVLIQLSRAITRDLAPLGCQCLNTATPMGKEGWGHGCFRGRLC